MSSACDHDGTGCDGANCACCCDACQALYEAAWAVTCATGGLCDACGVPGRRPLTYEELEETKGQHFYLACYDCEGAVRGALRAVGRCEVCRTLLSDKRCPDCDCRRSSSTATTPCMCRGCRIARRPGAEGAAAAQRGSESPGGGRGVPQQPPAPKE